VPEPVLAQVTEVASGRRDAHSGVTVTADSGDIWLIRAVSPKSSEFGVIAINLGRESREGSDDLRIRVDAVLADATATLERLGVLQPLQREIVIDRMLALDADELDTEQLKWVVLMVLSSQPGQDLAFQRLEDLVSTTHASGPH